MREHSRQLAGSWGRVATSKLGAEHVRVRNPLYSSSEYWSKETTFILQHSNKQSSVIIMIIISFRYIRDLITLKGTQPLQTDLHRAHILLVPVRINGSQLLGIWKSHFGNKNALSGLSSEALPVKATYKPYIPEVSGVAKNCPVRTYVCNAQTRQARCVRVLSDALTDPAPANSE